MCVQSLSSLCAIKTKMRRADACQNKGRACVYTGESRRSASFSSGTTVQGTDLPHDNDGLTAFGQSSVPPCIQIEAHEPSPLPAPGIETISQPVQSINTQLRPDWPDAMALDRLDIPTWSPTKWCFPFSDAHAWIGVEPWQSMAADQVLLDDFVCPSLSYTAGDGTELPSIPEVPTTASEQSPADVETA
ncbi:hypothetical protein RB213_005470, partial [Colletotrichum asianum]